MTAQILNGKAIAAAIQTEIKRRIETARVRPRLVSLSMGEDPAARVYLSTQKKAAASVGIDLEERLLPRETPQERVIDGLWALNRDASVHGILVQRPLPPHLDPFRIVKAIDPGKDVEGLHPGGLGGLVHGRPHIVPCTADAAVRLFRSTGIPSRGLEVVVVGHSEIVGKPIALLLVHEMATVTICHIGTRDLEAHTRRADVLFVAAGVPGLIRASGVKPGAVVIDIGINRVASGIVGDVLFDEVKEVAGYLTPVPGGVGPMTTAVLMENALRCTIDTGDSRQ